MPYDSDGHWIPEQITGSVVTPDQASYLRQAWRIDPKDYATFDSSLAAANDRATKGGMQENSWMPTNPYDANAFLSQDLESKGVHVTNPNDYEGHLGFGGFLLKKVLPLALAGYGANSLLGSIGSAAGSGSTSLLGNAGNDLLTNETLGSGIKAGAGNTGFGFNFGGAQIPAMGGGTGIGGAIDGLGSVTSGVMTPQMLATTGAGSAALVPGAVANSWLTIPLANAAAGSITPTSSPFDPSNLTKALQSASKIAGLLDPQGQSTGSGYADVGGRVSGPLNTDYSMHLLNMPTQTGLLDTGSGIQALLKKLGYQG